MVHSTTSTAHINSSIHGVPRRCMEMKHFGMLRQTIHRNRTLRNKSHLNQTVGGRAMFEGSLQKKGVSKGTGNHHMSTVIQVKDFQGSNKARDDQSKHHQNLKGKRTMANGSERRTAQLASPAGPRGGLGHHSCSKPPTRFTASTFNTSPLQLAFVELRNRRTCW